MILLTVFKLHHFSYFFQLCSLFFLTSTVILSQSLNLSILFEFLSLWLLEPVSSNPLILQLRPVEVN